ncbi:MAG TPA: ABC transporter ATP-binding protein [Puia sp.]|nr:ABC transporter ATP-binding protein [Puia sp.]
MSRTVIKVEGVSKKFILLHEAKEHYASLRDEISNRVKRLAGKTKDKPEHRDREEFFALRDLSFDIEQGDRLGIIGRNGAGKSTLLKILSRITEPTSGRISLRGRVASLLEVGTGFHPELTGRENIFLNGAILGMKRAEIRNRFDEIVAFAEVEKFLDTPVKRYSSGMYVRLAFAVAAHLEPEILIVDEVLSVGDAQFQKKCLGKMEDVSKNAGRTVLFVSHNIVVINQLCNKALLLSNGLKLGYGNTEDIVNEYLKSSLKNHTFTKKDKEVYFSGFRYYSPNSENLSPGEACIFELSIFCNTDRKKVHVAFGINDKYGNRLFTPFTKYNDETLELTQGENIVLCEIENLYLRPDVYYLHLYVGDGIQRYDYISEGISIEVAPKAFYSAFMPEEPFGHFLVNQKWLKK